MFNDRNKLILRIICLLSALYIVLPPLIKTWNWREDHFKLFDLSKEMQKNNTDFYTWLGVKPTATSIDIGKAHRQLVLKWHPETSTETEVKEKFEITNQVAYILRSPTLRPLYDSILLEHGGRLPYFKGLFYYYTHHKLVCMAILGLVAVSCMEYLKAWDTYLTEKLAFDQFIVNAKMMAQKISDKHASAKTHKSYIDLGERTIQCEITRDKEIFIFNEENERVPLSLANLLPMPSIFNTSLLRIPMKYIRGEKKTDAAVVKNKNK